MTKFGVVLRPELPPEEIVRAAVQADQSGVEQVWLWEDCFFSGGITMAASVLARTEKVEVGIGVLPTPLRNTALTALEIAALARVYPGRVRVGLGHGVQEWMDQVGARVRSPLTLLREQMSALRGLLNGHTLDVDGRYVKLSNVRLDWPPQQVPPLLVGATGPKTLALSGELGDGTILTSDTTPRMAEEAVALINPRSDHDIVIYVDAEADGQSLNAFAEAGATTIVLEPGPERRDLTAVFHRASVELPEAPPAERQDDPTR